MPVNACLNTRFTGVITMSQEVENQEANPPYTVKLFFTFVSGFADFERETIRERVKLGLARRRAEGKPLGRPKGSKDKGKRRKSGYYMRWSKTIKT
jgi:DNA invertase Pin-like site-specific DNA recombinase